MAAATPSLIPRDPNFPRLLPKPPQPHIIPLPKKPVYAHLNAFRDLQREMDDLSDEENELEELNNAVRNRGFGFLVPIGRSLTRQEEKNDAEEDTDDSASGHTGVAPSVQEDDGDPENDSNQDLDANMDDMDEDATADTEDNDEINEGDSDYEEEPSDMI